MFITITPKAYWGSMFSRERGSTFLYSEDPKKRIPDVTSVTILKPFFVFNLSHIPS